MSGKGKYTYPDGRKYEGEWLQEERSGQGTLTFPDGSKYEGQWLDGKQSKLPISAPSNGVK
jgi:hypothetical protein